MFGIVSCFGDVIYEGARSANGQYFNLLAVNATTVGVLYGIGEFLGYALRMVSGKLSDATGKHWVLIFLGYGALIIGRVYDQVKKNNPRNEIIPRVVLYSKSIAQALLIHWGSAAV